MSLVGFKARNHPQQATRDDVDDRRTPAVLFRRLHAQYAFTVDAAASPENAMLPQFWTRDDNALDQPWNGERVWCNPPYSNLSAWLDKAWMEMLNDCHLVVMLLPANRCEQAWWQEHVEPYRDRKPHGGVLLTTKFLPGRLRFEHSAEWKVPAKGDRPPFGCVLLTWERAR